MTGIWVKILCRCCWCILYKQNFAKRMKHGSVLLVHHAICCFGIEVDWIGSVHYQYYWECTKSISCASILLIESHDAHWIFAQHQSFAQKHAQRVAKRMYMTVCDTWDWKEQMIILTICIQSNLSSNVDIHPSRDRPRILQ